MDGYERLANEIVLSAVEDYRKGRKRLKKDLGDKNTVPMMLDALRFFRSGWYKMLTTVDAGIIIKQIQEEEI